MDGSNGSGDGLMAALFEAGGGLFALDTSRIEEIARAPAITPVRGSGDAVLGIANLRGRIITVLDATALLGLGRAAAGDDARILVTASGGESVGVLVERLRDVAEVERSSLRALSAGTARGGRAVREDLFLGAFEAQGRTAALLDPDKVLAAG